VNRRATQHLFRPLRGWIIYHFTHGLRRGLYSFAATRLKTFASSRFRKDSEPSDGGVLHNQSCQKLSFPEGESGERPPPILSFGGAARVTSATFSAPVSYPSKQPYGMETVLPPVVAVKS